MNNMTAIILQGRELQWIIMSRSYRHTPIFGTTGCPSEKLDKQKANRALRKAAQKSIRRRGSDELVVPVIREVSDVWCFGKDGKSYDRCEPEKRANRYSANPLFADSKYAKPEYWEKAHRKAMRK
jgi:hypothetical protein